MICLFFGAIKDVECVCMSHKSIEDRLEWIEYWIDRFDARLTKAEFKIMENKNE